MLHYVLLFLSAFFIVGTGVPLLGHDHWAIRVFDFPRVQLAGGATVTLFAYLIVGPDSLVEYGAMSLLAASIVHQIACILPHTPLAPKQVSRASSPDTGHTLSLLVVNVEIDNRDTEPLLQLIDETQPDLVLTLEPDDWWSTQLRILDDQYPHTVYHPRDNAYGMTLHSRYPLLESEVRFIVEDDVPSIHTQVELPGGEPVFFHAMHPRPPHPTHKPDTTERDAELLLLARELEDREAPTIIAGDLNDVSWSYTTRLFQKVSGLLDPRKGRGLYNTFHARYPPFRYPLDHVFHSNHFALAGLEVLPYVGSDHFPVWVELQYHPDQSSELRHIGADDVDQQQVDRELERLQEKTNGDR